MRIDDPKRPLVGGWPAFLVNGTPQGICMLVVEPNDLRAMLPTGFNKFAWHRCYAPEVLRSILLRDWEADPEEFARSRMDWKPWRTGKTVLKPKLSLAELLS